MDRKGPNQECASKTNFNWNRVPSQHCVLGGGGHVTVDLSEFLNAATGIGCCFRHAAAMVRG